MSDADTMIRILRPDEWSLVAPAVMGTFRDEMPATPAQSTFLGAFRVGHFHLRA